MNRPQLPAPKRTARGMLSKGITGVSVAVIAVLAVPAAALFVLIYAVWTLSDALSARLDRKA